MYIDSIYERDKDLIHVIERDKTGKRVFREFPAQYIFYYPDAKGKHRNLAGEPVSRFSTRSNKEFQKEKRMYGSKKLYESDINPVFRCLSENYLNADAPKLHTCFFDIEVDFDPERGFSPTTDPFNKITAVTVYLDWLDQLVTLCIPPKGMKEEEAQQITSKYENCLYFYSEIEMLETFFQLIEDADILTGWNSEGYDIPYMVNRVTRVMSKDDTRKFCLLGQLPRPKIIRKFGKEEQTYDLVGRVHMDYLQLYKKYNYEQRHSYKLDSIGEMEVGENKVPYEGTLDQLYNQDFNEFLNYNRQDVMLLVKIHNKLKFLDLANQLAHENTVLLPTVMGSVAMIEMAVYNEAHARGLVVPDKQRVNSFEEKFEEDDDAENDKAAGAYVATPKKGMHEWIGAVDINSLYPSTIRALNMAAETIVGQIRTTLTDEYMIKKGMEFARRMKKNKNKDDSEVEGLSGSMLWEGLFAALEYTAVMNQEIGTMLTIDWENGKSEEFSAAEIYSMIFESRQPWMLSANGTIFTYEREGVVPGLLSRWYSERKELQLKLKQSTTKEDQEYWDKRQLVKKILLNSAYGALLNEHCRFFDKRIGQSTTLCGRTIVQHQCAYLNELITGKYQHDGESVIYSDTDSTYFSAYSTLKPSIDSGELEWSRDTVVQVYDTLGEQVNESFPSFMNRAFHCPQKNGEILAAGRELVADRGIFITKKRYAVNIYDKEGKRLDKDGKSGKIKAMGLDLKRADTPKYIQEFLMRVLTDVLNGADRPRIIEYIKDFKRELTTQPGWTKGSPKSVNRLTHYQNLEQAQRIKRNDLKKVFDDLETGKGRANMPGHNRAALNWNALKEMNHDNYSMKIVDGMRIVVCKLKDNPLGYTSIAYPTDELRLPEWFKELPFDNDEMERVLVDEKVENLLGVLKWDLRIETDTSTTFDTLFTFG
jgi:DNA polymerase elongation subunit (family B)